MLFQTESGDLNEAKRIKLESTTHGCPDGLRQMKSENDESTAVQTANAEKPEEFVEPQAKKASKPKGPDMVARTLTLTLISDYQDFLLLTVPLCLFHSPVRALPPRAATSQQSHRHHARGCFVLSPPESGGLHGSHRETRMPLCGLEGVGERPNCASHGQLQVRGSVQ